MAVVMETVVEMVVVEMGPMGMLEMAMLLGMEMVVQEVAMEEACGTDVLACTDQVVGTTDGYSLFVDGSPTSIYMLSVFTAMEVVV
jgi:hypothetical protein